MGSYSLQYVDSSFSDLENTHALDLFQQNNFLYKTKIYSKFEQEYDCEVDFSKGYDHSSEMKDTTQKSLAIYIGGQQPIFVYNDIQDYMVPT